MGQEIHYCSVCGVRLRSADFDRGEAVRSDAAPYCRACAAGAGLSPEPSRAAKERNTTRRIAVAGPTSTARIPVATPRRGIEAVSSPRPSPALVWGAGLALGVGIALAAAMALGGGGPSRPAAAELAAVRPPRPVESPRPAAPAAAPARPDGPRPAPPTSEAAELAELDRRVADAVSHERFRAALDLLESE